MKYQYEHGGEIKRLSGTGMECEKLDDKLSSDSLVVVNMVEVNNSVNYIILTTLMEYVSLTNGNCSFV